MTRREPKHSPGKRRPTPRDPTRRSPRKRHPAKRARRKTASRASANSPRRDFTWPVEDAGLAAGATALMLLGIVMSYSVTAPLAIDQAIPPLFARHLVALILGIGIAFGASRIPLEVWRGLAIPAWALGMLMLVATVFFGTRINGAQRWLELPLLGFRFQPAEFVKFATLLAVAAVTAQRDGRQELSDRRAAMAAALVIPPVLVLVNQPDLGNALLLALLAGLMLIVGGIPLRRILPGAVVIALGTVLYVFRNPYAMRRITAFLDPWADAHGSGFQLIQSFVGFAHGGLLGAGLGNGRQKLFYLPEAHTDFILTVIAEELGLLGVFAVFAAFTAMLAYGSRIARRAHNRFALLLAFGMTTLLTVPAIINAAVVMGALPTKGLTLPFLSYGRTSLIVCCAALGALLAVGRSEAVASPLRGGRSVLWR
jgi:cell division protein FtsW